ncbi:hypothetical protein CVT25_006237 [Psilocybe cyanescens]|uniref:Uncharacterized protein n=1 Tax=Psilocybe cyanescens TaxID=93625 RepID=A0A409XKJ3_PSICY|nr:hypothetical protein CVT25_006237 [Psilocybe cyanescens]
MSSELHQKSVQRSESSLLCPLRFQFSGAEFSRHGKPILTVIPPSAASSALREHRSGIISCLRNALEVPDDNPILIYPDRP